MPDEEVLEGTESEEGAESLAAETEVEGESEETQAGAESGTDETQEEERQHGNKGKRYIPYERFHEVNTERKQALEAYDRAAREVAYLRGREEAAQARGERAPKEELKKAERHLLDEYEDLDPKLKAYLQSNEQAVRELREENQRLAQQWQETEQRRTTVEQQREATQAWGSLQDRVTKELDELGVVKDEGLRVRYLSDVVNALPPGDRAALSEQNIKRLVKDVHGWWSQFTRVERQRIVEDGKKAAAKQPPSAPGRGVTQGKPKQGDSWDSLKAKARREFADGLARLGA